MVQQQTTAGYKHTKNVEGYGQKRNLTSAASETDQSSIFY